jgi:NAD(P)-dependent dehydrogenase (short-subunit alcohol dehydrogenase family)
MERLEWRELPMRSFGDLEEPTKAPIFLAPDAAGFVTGQMLAVDGSILGERRQSTA